MLIVSRDVLQAIDSGKSIVGFETAIFSHGLPKEQALGLLKRLRELSAEEDFVLAAFGIVRGVPKLGLTDTEIEEIIASAQRKVGLGDIGYAIATKATAGATVSATLWALNRAGIRVMATGGIGGVHREVEKTFDISADIPALSRFRVAVVCSGAKIILDIPKTLELLETFGIPVIGFKTDEFPAFYSKESGLKVSVRADDIASLAEIANAHFEIGLGSLLVVVPPPKEIPRDKLEEIVEEGLRLASEKGIKGKEVTPFLLRFLADKTRGETTRVNLDLVVNNTRVAGRLAGRLCEG